MSLTPQKMIAAVRAAEMLRHPSGERQELLAQTCEGLCEQLRQSDAQDVFNVLFPLACSRSKDLSFYGLHALAGHLLFFLKPPCPLACPDSLRSISQSDRDLSLKEVPWYLAAVFGPDTMRRSLAELETEKSMKQERSEQEAWHASHSHLRSFNDWKEISQQQPPGNAVTRLDTIRYWLEMFKQNDITKTWQPFWL